jgi:hypothetical protein
MTHARAWLVLLALASISVAGTFVPADANAFTSWYNCVNKPHSQWCDGRANGSYDGQHSWDYNSASNPNGNGVSVCQRVYHPASGTSLSGHGCAIDWATNYYGDVQCACYDAEVLHFSGGSMNINGFADAAW